MYEKLAGFAQTGGLVLFITAFILVLIYALSPKRKTEFKNAREIPLREEEENNGGEKY